MAFAYCTPRAALDPRRFRGGMEKEWNRIFGWSPPADVRETDEAYTFELEIPGVAKEDLHIEAEGNVLTIKGERKPAAGSEHGTCVRSERSHGAFERSFEITDGFEADRIEAKLENGILRVTLPKREASKPKHITVAVN